MDNFIEKLHGYITDLSDSEDVVAYNQAVTMLESLGEHSKNMLQVGILQDKLIEMGFGWCGRMTLAYGEDYELIITFCLHGVCVMEGNHKLTFQYNSPTWQNDLLSAISMRIS